MRSFLGGDGKSSQTAAVGPGQIVVDSLGYADDPHGVARQGRYASAGVHRVVAAVVEEKPNVVAAKDVDEYGIIIFSELASAGSESRARCRGEPPDSLL